MSHLLQCTYPDPGFWTATSLIQLGYGVWVNLSIVTIGLTFGFSAVAIPQLNVPDSDIVLTIEDESWIASVLTLVSPIGCVLCGYCMDKFGRRVMLVISGIPVCIGWFYTGLAQTARQIIAGRVITGVGIGMVMSVPRVYMTEISLPNMRGVIGSIPNIAMSIGITAQAGLGAFLHWTILCYICGIYVLLLIICNVFLPETPYFLLQKASIEDAEQSLKKFRSKKHNIDAEMDEMLDFKIDNNIRRLTLREQISAMFLKSSCKPFFLMLIYLLITQVSGVTIFTMWAVDILQHSKSIVEAHMANVMLGITRLLAGILTSILILRVGRRPLALTSGFGVGVSAFVLSLIIIYKESPSVYPQVCFVAYITFATLGHYTLPVLIMFELYPLQIRGILGGISIAILNFLMFGANKSFPYVRDALGYAHTIMGFGVCSLLGCLFLYFYLPETKGLTLQEIEEYYKDVRPTLTSQRRIRSEMIIKSVASGVSKSLLRVDRHRDRSMSLRRIPPDGGKEAPDDTKNTDKTIK